MKTLVKYSTELTPTFVKVLKSLKLNTEDAQIKRSPFQPELSSLEFDSIYDSGRFRLNTLDNTVERVQASFDKNENKVIKTTIYSVINTEDVTFVVTNPENIDEIEKESDCYDHYVGARELDYRDGVKENKRTLQILKELGVVNVTYKNITPMFSNTPKDISINL